MLFIKISNYILTGIFKTIYEQLPAILAMYFVYVWCQWTMIYNINAYDMQRLCLLSMIRNIYVW